jgi:hypothetical protein
MSVKSLLHRRLTMFESFKTTDHASRDYTGQDEFDGYNQGIDLNGP